MRLYRLICSAAAGVLALLGLSAHAGAVDTSVTMTANACYKANDIIVVNINKGVSPVAVAGGQFFLSYDNTHLAYVGGAPGDGLASPYTFEVLDQPPASPMSPSVSGVVDYASGVDPFSGSPGVTTAQVMARLSFRATAEICPGAALLTVRTHTPASRLSDASSIEVASTITGLGAVRIDSTLPVISCPVDLNVSADAPVCTHTFSSFAPATATDNCTATLDIAISYIRYIGMSTTPDSAHPSVLDPFPTGPTKITWKATDCSGNSSTCDQIVTVLTTSSMNATVRISGAVLTAFDRCITFQLNDTSTCPASPVTVEAVMHFSGGVAAGVVPVPCGFYNCITARDRLHSLRRTANPTHFSFSGGSYSCTFVNDGGGDDTLLGGNLNDDSVVDILDFGGYVGQFGHSYGPNTTCATSGPQADFDGNGLVDIDDYSFISAQFLAFRESDCCGVALLGDGAGISDISVFDLAGIGHWEIARTADLNHDGRVNFKDISFMFEHGVSRCTGDFDGVNGSNIDDIFAYLNSWFGRHPACDIDENRVVNIDDLFGFINVWFTGCN